MMHSLRTPLAFLSLLPLTAAATTSCSWTSGGSSWDLTPMRLSPSGANNNPYYNVSDIRAIDTVYTFNVCADVAAPPTTPSNACNTGGRTQTRATAWQVQNDGNENPDDCYRLGTLQTSGWNFGIYDPAYPARGVNLVYTGGDNTWCYDGGRVVSRSMTLSVTCDPTVTGSAYRQGSGISVVETSACAYSLQLPSRAGCPLQCLTGRNLCSGHGVCGYNNDTQVSQCYCYNGWEGNACSVPISSGGMSTEGVLLIIVCLALAGVLGFLAYMVLKLRRLNVNPQAYGQLEGKFNELSQMA